MYKVETLVAGSNSWRTSHISFDFPTFERALDTLMLAKQARTLASQTYRIVEMPQKERVIATFDF